MPSLGNEDWSLVRRSLLDRGFSVTQQLLSPEACRRFVDAYDIESNFRAKINMDQYHFGKGEYKYFAYPLPVLVQELRTELYAHLVDAANVWCKRMAISKLYPPTVAEFLEQCKKRNQVRPTPLMLRYEEGDFNCLHQDLYGDLFFPFQVVFALSKPGEDYLGGELVLVQQRPRMQSVPHVVELNQGQAVIFAVNSHPEQGKRGYFRTTMRHGVSEVTRGKRFTLGIIFHDAK